MTGSTPHELPKFPPRIGRYTVIAPIGMGGMATVALASIEGLGGFRRKVAIKLLHPQFAGHPASIKQFLNEAKIASHLHHPNAVGVLDVGQDECGVFLVMEYVDGASLSALMRAAKNQGVRLPVAVKLRILCDALRGLHAAHELADETGNRFGVIHRDFSPQNILLGLDGRGRIADFGVAKIQSGTSHTGEGVVKGKLRYMPPEQLRGRKSLELDRRCDVWAAGVVAWELFAEQRLHKTRDDVELLVEVVSATAAPLTEVCPELPAAVAQAVANALERDRERRTPSAEAFRLALEEAFAPQVVPASEDEVAEWVEGLSRAARGRLAQRIAEQSGHDDASSESKDAASAAPAPTPPEPRSVAAGVEYPPQEPTRRGRRTLVATLLLGVAAVAIAATFPTFRSAPAEPASPALPPPPSSSPEPAASPTQAAASLNVEANAPVRRLEVGARVYDYEQPRVRWQVPAPRASRGSIRIAAQAEDGRHVRFEQDLPIELLRVTFPAKPAARTPPPSKASKRAPSAKSGRGDNSGLAPIDF